MNSAALLLLKFFLYFSLIFFHSHHFNYRRTHKSSGDTNQFCEMKMTHWWLAAFYLKRKENVLSHRKTPMIALWHDMTIRKIYGNRLFLIAFSATFFSLLVKCQCTSNYVTYRTLIRVLALTLVYIPFQNWTSLVSLFFAGISVSYLSNTMT